MPPIVDPQVLVGTSTADDAGVYRISDELALVQTLDFITPIVDDPFVFGQVAAANSLSDVYAMGGVPMVALNIVCFPSKVVPLEVLGKILAGGSDKAREAGIEIMGGHSVDDPEPKYGLVVTGRIHPDRVYTNAGARPGDHLVLTKPIGTGIMTTAIKKGLLPQSGIDEVVRSMTTLNRNAAEVLAEFDVHGVTDVTGFGLMGHLYEMVCNSGLGATVRFADVPIMSEVTKLAQQQVVPGGSKRNWKRVEGFVEKGEALTTDQIAILCDPQTSGGLLIAVSAKDATALQERLASVGTLAAADVGEFSDRQPGRIEVLI